MNFPLREQSIGSVDFFPAQEGWVTGLKTMIR
jgi:hypothetical protein